MWHKLMKYIFRINNLKIKFNSKDINKTSKDISFSYSLSSCREGKNFESYKILCSKFIKKIL